MRKMAMISIIGIVTGAILLALGIVLSSCVLAKCFVEGNCPSYCYPNFILFFAGAIILIISLISLVWQLKKR